MSQKTAGILSVSSPISPFPRRLERAVEEVERRGMRAVFSEHALDAEDYRVGHPSRIASDLHAFLTSPEIDLIILSTGGVTGNGVIEYIDYKVFEENWKPVCGFSDATPLLLALHAQTGLPVYHGPTLLPSFGDFGGLNDDTFNSFKSNVLIQTENYSVPQYGDISHDMPVWEFEDDKPLGYSESSGFTVIRQGQDAGKLIGGNLRGVISLLGTRFLPDFTGAVLFLDIASMRASELERHLYHLKQAGVLDKLSGLLVSQLDAEFGSDKGRAHELLRRILDEIVTIPIPIISNVNCGHTRPLETFPIGKYASIEASDARTGILVNMTPN